jgi:hypothetical protein
MAVMIPQFEDSLMLMPKPLATLLATGLVAFAGCMTPALAATAIDPQLAALVASPQRSANFVTSASSPA